MERENEIVLFFEKEKTNDKGPDLTGALNVGGKEYRVAMWSRKTNKDGTKFYSGQVAEKESK